MTRNFPLTFFVKTEKGLHTGGFAFFSDDEFKAAKPQLELEAQRICQTHDQTLKSWGVTDSLGNVVEEFKPKKT